MNNKVSPNKLTFPGQFFIGVFTALSFVQVTTATCGSAVIFPSFNNAVLPAMCALIFGCVYMFLAAKLQKFSGISVVGRFRPVLPTWKELP